MESPLTEKEKEKNKEQADAGKIAVLTVLKKGSILKNIFLNCPPRPSSNQRAEEAGCLRRRGVSDEDEDDTRILIGRHPDCQIALDHPSISRFHLELRLSPSEQRLSVVDRSSVHGTWVSGTRIPPNVPVNMVDGDSLRLGASTRIYRLQWVSASRACEMENPLAPLLEEETYQDDSNNVTTSTSEQRDSEIPQESLPDEKNVEIFQDDSSNVTTNTSEQRDSEIPQESLPDEKSVENFQGDSSNVTTNTSEQQDSEILQESLPDEKNVEIFQDHPGHKEIDDMNAQWILEMPSAPSMMEFMSPASKKAVEDSTISSLVAPMLECFSSLFPLIGENPTSVSESSSGNEEQSHKGCLSPLRSEKGVSSSLLSRRSKSKSVSCLRIQTGRNKEGDENTTAHIGKEEGTVEGNSTVTKQVEIQKTLYRAPINNLDAQEEVKDALDVHKENVSLMSPLQKMKKSSALQQKSLSTALRMEEDQTSSVELQKKSISVSCFGIKTGKNKEIIGNTVADKGTEEGSRKENNGVCEQVEVHETLCSVLFDSLSRQEEEKHLFDSDKENITPMSSHKHMKKDTTLQQKSLDSTLSAEEDLSRPLQQKSRSNHRLRIRSVSKARFENTITDQKIGETRKKNWTCSEQVRSEEEDKDIFDSDKENVTPMSACQKMKKSSTILQKTIAATLSLEEDMGSTVQQKSRSVSCLKIQSERSKERIESTIADSGLEEGTRKGNFTFCEQVDSEEILCKVMFDSLGAQEEDKGIFSSDKENVTPILARQNKKNNTLWQNSFAVTLNMEEDLNVPRHMNSRELSSKKVEILTSYEEKSELDSGDKSKKSNVRPLESFILGSGGHVNNLDKANWTPEIARSINFEEVRCENSAKSYIEEGYLMSDTENMTTGSELELKNHRELPHSIDNLNVAQHLSHLDKDNYRLNSVDANEAPLSPKYNVKFEETGCSAGKKNQASVVSRFLKSKELLSEIGALSSEHTMKIKDEENGCSSDKENQTPQSSKSVKTKLSSEHTMKIKDEENGCSSDKENQTPQASKSVKTKEPLSETTAKIQREIMKKRVDRIPFQSLLEENSASRTQSNIICEKSTTFSNAQKYETNERVDRIPFQSLLETSASRSQSNIICEKSTTFSNAQKYETNDYLNQSTTGVPHRIGQEKKIWNIVVDTDCLLDEESRRSLQLLEGTKGTHLIIPRIVIRELDNLKRHESFFRKSTRASSVLKWIEDCMENVGWWIHVQSSFETVPVQPTPPVSPQAPSSNASIDDVPKFLAFSTYGSFVEIVSPTAEDHILDCALLFKKIKNDGHLVLLSNSTTLKIKAMAEGLLCETAKEFRESLVNPFSKRFLWVDSSPRGPTWSCVNEVGLFDNYHCHRPAVRKSVKVAEPARGLKLILLHNSQYRQYSSVK